MDFTVQDIKESLSEFGQNYELLEKRVINYSINKALFYK
jgi:hypothetical protein